MIVKAGDPFEAVFESGVSGQVGTVTVKVTDNDGVNVIAPTTVGIAEDGVSGVYIWNAPAAPGTLGQYSIVWSLDGSFTPAGGMGVDELVVTATSAAVLPPISTPDSGPSPGPCNQWTTNDEIAICCSAEVGSDLDLYEEVNTAASRVLWELSGRRFPGVCEKTVRPLCDDCYCGYQVLSRGHLVVPPGSFSSLCNSCLVACSPSRVLLSGAPVREILEVKIDGAVLAASEYRLDAWRYLTRKNNARWPSTQNLTLDDTEDGTWSVTYSYGENPPEIGQLAARELACELYKSCQGDLECSLPAGISRIQRQGIVIERSPFIAWGRQQGIWRTGLPMVDLFLNAYNPAGIKRRPVIMTPGRRVYPMNA